MDDDFEDENEPAYSNAFNVYLHSDDPRLGQAAEKIFKDIKFHGHKTLIKNHLKILILNFLHAKKNRKQGILRYSRRNEYWRDFNEKWPNPWGVSAKLDDVVDTLARAGLVTLKMGYVGNNYKKQTRFKPTAKFTKLYVKPLKLLEMPLDYHKDFPLVRVHIKSESLYEKGIVEHRTFEARGKTKIPNQLRHMKDQLRSYNRLILSQKISLDDVPETQELRNSIDYNLKNRTYRVFSNKEINEGGRLYGGWWQGLSSSLRSFILINGQRTVECDYKAQHAYMLYGHCLRKPMENVLGQGVDPYVIDGFPRELGKAVFTRALNVRSRRHLKDSLTKRFQNDLSAGNDKDRKTAQVCMPYVMDSFDVLMGAFENLHKPLLSPQRYLYPQTSEKKWWRKFQFYDSQICMYVLDTLRKERIPCLSVHDSFIVEEKNEARLKEVMKDGYLNAEHIPDLSYCIPEIKTTKRMY